MARIHALVAIFLCNIVMPQAYGAAEPPPYGQYPATVSTPLSSGFHKAGDRVQVILNHGAYTAEGHFLPPGTRLRGRVTEVEPGTAAQSGKLQVLFHQAFVPGKGLLGIQARLEGVNGETLDPAQIRYETPNPSFKSFEAHQRSQGGSQPSAASSPDRNIPAQEVIFGVGEQIRIRFD